VVNTELILMLKPFIISCLFIFLCGCQSSKESQSQVKAETPIVIPDDINITPDIGPEVRDIQIQWFEKGKVLYKIHCGDCHGIFAKGKDGVPNFTQKQIDNYKAMVLANPGDHQVIKKISEEQFNYIMAFLRLRKLNQ
jgi:hypothetical protein